ncbi:hypothetical protein DMH04_39710 [Kibdelosporangium aridum]|uniref:Uncharacterized protein n=1 Tax=Kibdelosporangium aridum TaxID=2030 RepID=A0A428YWL7_KIBAR|nr:hypothetical protein [Kibdelosporangium aridum]RSM74585.1 hypothetical protein DMH04_39710 [Kibdelosporangium aridum]
MRKTTIFGAAAVGITTLFLTGDLANAGTNPKISLSKSKVTAGEEIKVTGSCHMDVWAKSPLHSDALEAGSAVGRANQEGPDVAGVAKVKKNVKPGTYTVSFKCGDLAAVTKLTVVSAEQKTPKPGQVKVKPKGAADTGGDGIVEAAPAGSNGPDTGLHTLGGAGLAAVAGGAGVFLLRRRSRA